MAMAMTAADGVTYAGSALGQQSVWGEVVALDGAIGTRRWSAQIGVPVAALVVTGGAVVGCWDILISGGTIPDVRARHRSARDGSDRVPLPGGWAGLYLAEELSWSHGGSHGAGGPLVCREVIMEGALTCRWLR